MSLRIAGLAVLAAAVLSAQAQDPEELRRRQQRLFAPELELGWIDIMPDASLKGWTRLPIPPEQPLDPVSQWSVKDRVLICEGNKGHEWLRWDRELKDFVFRAEWRFTPVPGQPRYNSGIFVRNSADGRIWHQAQTGDASGGYIFGNTLVNGAPQRLNLRTAMGSNRVRPAGEWNVFEIRCEGPKITVEANGEVTSVFPSCEVRRGHLGLEAEGYRIEFRNLRVKTLNAVE